MSGLFLIYGHFAARFWGSGAWLVVVQSLCWSESLGVYVWVIGGRALLRTPDVCNGGLMLTSLGGELAPTYCWPPIINLARLSLGCRQQVLEPNLFAAGLLTLWTDGAVAWVHLLELGGIQFLQGRGQGISWHGCPSPTFFQWVIRHGVFGEATVESIAFP